MGSTPSSTGSASRPGSSGTPEARPADLKPFPVPGRGYPPTCGSASSLIAGLRGSEERPVGSRTDFFWEAGVVAVGDLVEGASGWTVSFLLG